LSRGTWEEGVGEESEVDGVVCATTKMEKALINPRHTVKFRTSLIRKHFLLEESEAQQKRAVRALPVWLDAEVAPGVFSEI
jgi:hypothetical protein